MFVKEAKRFSCLYEQNMELLPVFSSEHSTQPRGLSDGNHNERPLLSYLALFSHENLACGHGSNVVLNYVVHKCLFSTTFV